MWCGRLAGWCGLPVGEYGPPVGQDGLPVGQCLITLENTPVVDPKVQKPVWLLQMQALILRIQMSLFGAADNTLVAAVVDNHARVVAAVAKVTAAVVVHIQEGYMQDILEVDFEIATLEGVT